MGGDLAAYHTNNNELAGRRGTITKHNGADNIEKTIPRVLYTLAVINLVGVNANRIRTKRKKLMLHRLLRELKAGIGVITETHMQRAELAKLHFPDYYIRGECCRTTPVGERK